MIRLSFVFLCMRLMFQVPGWLGVSIDLCAPRGREQGPRGHRTSRFSRNVGKIYTSYTAKLRITRQGQHGRERGHEHEQEHDSREPQERTIPPTHAPIHRGRTETKTWERWTRCSPVQPSWRRRVSTSTPRADRRGALLCLTLVGHDVTTSTAQNHTAPHVAPGAPVVQF